MRVAIIHFPGSSIDDAIHAFKNVLGHEAYTVWHEEEDLKKPDLVFLPGGTSFGDYLRPGGLAKASRIAGSLRSHARKGTPMLGVGNGFQILCEMEILAGTVLVNPDLCFCNTNAYISVEGNNSPFTQHLELGNVLQLPLACNYGRYFGDSRVYKTLEEGEQIILRYCDKFGDTDTENTVNGSMDSIAGITSRHKNVMGMIPHPERAMEALTGGTDGMTLLNTITPFFVD